MQEKHERKMKDQENIDSQNEQDNKIYLCPKCGGRIVVEDVYDVSPGYFGACLKCDEDFYEIKLIKSKEVYNDESNKFSDWTTKKLKDEASAYHQSLYNHECYGTGDIMAYDGILRELSTRGIDPSTELIF